MALLQLARRQVLPASTVSNIYYSSTSSLLFANSNPSHRRHFSSTTATATSNKMSLPDFSSLYPLSLTNRPPICNLVPPSQCQFTPNFTSVPLLNRIPCGNGGTSFILRFGLPDTTKPMDLTTCACLLASANLLDDTTKEIVEVTRPYTPISTNDQVGCFDLLIKNYNGEQGNGWLSKHMCEELDIGEMVQFKHIDFNIKIPAPFSQKKVGMIAGGTGITPMIQALHAILGETSDESQQQEKESSTDEVTLLYGSRHTDDILGGEMLHHWVSLTQQKKRCKFNYIDILSDEPNDSEYDGERGFIDKEKIIKYLPPPSLGDDVIILVCGPPIMYEVLCGPRTEKEVTGVLGELGYTSDQVYKF